MSHNIVDNDGVEQIRTAFSIMSNESIWQPRVGYNYSSLLPLDDIFLHTLDVGDYSVHAWSLDEETPEAGR